MTGKGDRSFSRDVDFVVVERLAPGTTGEVVCELGAGAGAVDMPELNAVDGALDAAVVVVVVRVGRRTGGDVVVVVVVVVVVGDVGVVDVVGFVVVVVVVVVGTVGTVTVTRGSVSVADVVASGEDDPSPWATATPATAPATRAALDRAKVHHRVIFRMFPISNIRRRRPQRH